MKVRTVIANRRGIALMITISVITVLIAAALTWNRRARSSVEGSAAARDRLALSALAASGVHAAMAMLIKDRIDSDSDSLQEDWANPDKIAEVLSKMPFSEGSVTFKITDELSKIQINALVQFPDGREFNETQRQLWERMIRLLPRQENPAPDLEPTAIINSIKDWLDSGDDDAITGISGAESGYYQGLDPPYACQNGPFRHLGELSLVKGVTPELLSGAGGAAGLSAFVTPYGMSVNSENKFTFEGRININTADLPVLAALLPEDRQDLAQAIDEYRLEKNDLQFIHELSKPSWYQNVPGMGDVQIDPNLITTQSDIYRIDAAATLHGLQMVVSAVVQREKDKESGRWRCNLLNWEIK